MLKVGHNALGAGRVFDQGAKLVANAIDDGSFKAAPVHILGIALVATGVKQPFNSPSASLGENMGMARRKCDR